MEQSAHRHTNVLVVAQHGPDGGKPFFGVVNLKPTWAEYEARFHHQVARAVLIEQGCAPSPMTCCDMEDLPLGIKQGFASQGFLPLPTFQAEPHHYEQARQFGDAN